MPSVRPPQAAAGGRGQEWGRSPGQCLVTKIWPRQMEKLTPKDQGLGLRITLQSAGQAPAEPQD